MFIGWPHLALGKLLDRGRFVDVFEIEGFPQTVPNVSRFVWPSADKGRPEQLGINARVPGPPKTLRPPVREIGERELRRFVIDVLNIGPAGNLEPGSDDALSLG